jgi:exodeoxyribonuclease VII small subunit
MPAAKSPKSDKASKANQSALSPLKSSPLPSSPLPPDADWNYEDTVEKIEDIIAQIEAGELGLAQVFEQFGAAVSYLQQCDTFLSERQAQVDLLVETLQS